MTRQRSKPKGAPKKPTRGTRFEVFQRDDGQWGFHLMSRNGRIMLQSEGYPSTSHCRRAIRSIARVVAALPVVVLKDGTAL